MNENDKRELLQQLERCKGTLDVVTTFGDNRFCGSNCMLDCQSCYNCADLHNCTGQCYFDKEVE